MIEIDIHPRLAETAKASAERVARAHTSMGIIRSRLDEMRAALASDGFGATMRGRYVEREMTAGERAALRRAALGPGAREVCLAAAKLRQMGIDLRLPENPGDLIDSLIGDLCRDSEEDS